jgi:hypothetical protein
MTFNKIIVDARELVVVLFIQWARSLNGLLLNS